MRYWLTTHWPPREDHQFAPLGVWLENGKESAASGMEQGDLVFIYQLATGRSVVEKHVDGSVTRARRIPGRQGIVTLAQVLEKPWEQADHCGPETYADGTTRWWRYLAHCDSINTAGYVPCSQVAQILGFSENYNFRGFGKLHSGLQELSASEFGTLRAAFTGSSNPTDEAIRAKILGGGWGGHGGCGEGPVHLALKNAIAADPSNMLAEDGLALWSLEYAIPSGDRVDIVLTDSLGRFVAVEVEVACEKGEIVGPLQCMKYRALISYLHQRRPEQVRAILVAHAIDKSVADACKSYGIECQVAPKVGAVASTNT